MGMYDYVEGVPEGCDDQLKLWNCELRTYRLGDRVPMVEGVETYSVRLQGGGEPHYLLVIGGRITRVGVKSPLEGSPIFSKWGGPEDEENPVAVAIREEFG